MEEKKENHRKKKARGLVEKGAVDVGGRISENGVNLKKVGKKWERCEM